MIGVGDSTWSVTLLSSPLVALAFLFVRTFLEVRKRRYLLTSGDTALTTSAVLNEIELSQVPLSYRGFTLVALGEFGAARMSLLVNSPPEEIVARDYELCAEVLMLAFESQAEQSLEFARRLVQLSLDGERHQARRLAVISIARVMAGVHEEEDWVHLQNAAIYEPALYWPCRYAAANVLCQNGGHFFARRLIARAPLWPSSSYFAKLHAELAANYPNQPTYPYAA